MRDIIYSLSDEYNCGVWDFYTIMGGLNSVQAWYSLNMMKYDRYHQELLFKVICIFA